MSLKIKSSKKLQEIQKQRIARSAEQPDIVSGQERHPGQLGQKKPPQRAILSQSQDAFEIENGVLKKFHPRPRGSFELYTVEIPESVHEIGEDAFIACFGLKEVRIPSNVKKIGDGAFFDCFDLKKVYIPESVEYIGSEAFGNGDGVPTATIVASHGSYAEKYAQKMEKMKGLFLSLK